MSLARTPRCQDKTKTDEEEARERWGLTTACACAWGILALGENGGVTVLTAIAADAESEARLG